MALLQIGSERTSRHTECVFAAPSLRTWLRQDWAILFSHPDDFVRCDLEMDRWILVLQNAFADRGIRPLALAQPGSGQDALALPPARSGAAADNQRDRSWIAQVSGDARTILLDVTQPGSGAFDLPALTLKQELAALTLQSRCVVILDSSLQRHTTFTYRPGFAYRPGTELPSPLDFLGRASALRADALLTHQPRTAPAAADAGFEAQTSRAPALHMGREQMGWARGGSRLELCPRPAFAS
jgi:hypothetical protein